MVSMPLVNFVIFQTFGNSMNKKFSDIARDIPKAEFHLHIEGALPLELLAKIDKNFEYEKPRSWRDSFRFKDFSEFDNQLLSIVVPWYNTPERYAEAATTIFAKMSEDNIDYVEISFASGIVQFLKIAGDEIADAIASSAPKSMRVKVFMGVHHDGRPREMERVFEKSFDWKKLDGVDLHGDERVPLEKWTREYWFAMRDSGRHTKAHAGELCGADFVERVVDELGVTQIEHGVRAAESERLMRRLANEKIVLDVCPTSNIKLRVSDSYQTHQMKRLRQFGVLHTLNSDDPLIFGAGLVDEYINLERKIGMSVKECFDVAKRGWLSAKISDSERLEKIKKIEKFEKEILTF